MLDALGAVLQDVFLNEGEVSLVGAHGVGEIVLGDDLLGVTDEGADGLDARAGLQILVLDLLVEGSDKALVVCDCLVLLTFTGDAIFLIGLNNFILNRRLEVFIQCFPHRHWILLELQPISGGGPTHKSPRLIGQLFCFVQVSRTVHGHGAGLDERYGLDLGRGLHQAAFIVIARRLRLLTLSDR